MNTGEKSWQTRGMSLADRLEFRTIRIPFSECWYFDGHHDEDGYPNTSINGRCVRAIRAFYEEFVGAIPDGLVLDHRTCQDRACVNYRHVEPVTNRVNVVERSATSVSAINARKTLCAYGHSDWRVRDGIRVCWTCERRRWTEEHARRKAKLGRGDRPDKRTHCNHGHEFTPENTFQKKGENGKHYRSCLACSKQRQEERKRKRIKKRTKAQFCKRGHARTPENVYGGRACKICMATAYRETLNGARQSTRE